MPESIFEDLPDENKGENQEPVKTEEEKARESEEIKNLEKAHKREDARIAKLRADLAEKRVKAKNLKEGKADDEEDDEEEKKPEAPSVEEAISKAFKEKEEESRKADLVSRIRKIAKNRQEAERIFEEAMKLPPTGNNDLDVEFAATRVSRMRESQRGYISPSLGGGAGFTDMETGSNELEGFSPERLAWFKSQGMSKDEIKKFKNGPDLSRVFPKVYQSPKV